MAAQASPMTKGEYMATRYRKQICFAIVVIILMHGCTANNNISSVRPRVSVGVTIDYAPLLSYSGDGNMQYQTNFRRFSVALFDYAHKPIGRLNGVFRPDRNDMFSLAIQSEISQPVELEFLGIGNIQTKLEQIADNVYLLPNGSQVMEIRGEGVMHYEWEHEEAPGEG